MLGRVPVQGSPHLRRLRRAGAGLRLVRDSVRRNQRVKVLLLGPHMSMSRHACLVLVCLVGSLAVGDLLVAQDAKNEVEVLFQAGGNLDKFRGYKDEAIGKGWMVDGDSIHFDGSGGGDLVTRAEYTSFQLDFEWKVDKGANSGVMYRVSLGDPAPYFSGPEYQILDDDVHGDGKNPLTSAGAIYAMYKPENKALKPVGEWNSGRIVLTGNHLETYRVPGPRGQGLVSKHHGAAATREYQVVLVKRLQSVARCRRLSRGLVFKRWLIFRPGPGSEPSSTEPLNWLEPAVRHPTGR